MDPGLAVSPLRRCLCKFGPLKQRPWVSVSGLASGAGVSENGDQDGRIWRPRHLKVHSISNKYFFYFFISSAEQESIIYNINIINNRFLLCTRNKKIKKIFITNRMYL